MPDIKEFKVEDKVENKEVKTEEKVNPQILEMQQTMQEMSSRLEQATKILSEKDKEIEEMRNASTKAVSDKIAKEKDLKAAFGIKKEEKAPKSLDDINSLSNAEMMEIFADAVENMVEATRQEASSEIDQNFKGLESKFDNVVSHIMRKEADVELQRLKTTNKDFDNYTDDIRKVLKQHQDFTLEDAYDWVKMKEKKGEIAPKHVESEKPDKDLSASDEDVVRSKRQPEGKKISSKRQFRMNLEEAIDRVQSRRGGQK